MNETVLWYCILGQIESPNFITTANNHKEINCRSIWDGWEERIVPASQGCKLSMACSLQIVLQCTVIPVRVGNTYTQHSFKRVTNQLTKTKQNKNYMRRQFQNWILFSFLLQNRLSGFESDDTIRYCFHPIIPHSMLIQT